ncbi:MAG: alpha/beta hydrolase [Planctomycetales bacterium]|nr:alpha/beta hydrolase [Planctomycetales bacterium]
MKSFFLATLAVAAPLFAAAARAGESQSYESHFGEVYAARDDGPLKADVYVPEGAGPFPGVLVVHGGAWRMGTRAQLSGLAERLAREGFTAVAISYRLAPKHLFPAQVEDCQDAVRWMRSNAARWKIDPERIGGLGYSAGGHLVALLGALNGAPIDAAELAAADAADAPAADVDDLADDLTEKEDPAARLQAVIAGGAPCDFRVMPSDSERLAFWLGGSRSAKPAEYRFASPAAFVTADDPPMFFYHGEDDQLVPVASPEWMCEQLSQCHVDHDLYVVPRVGHGAAAGDSEALTRAAAFLKAHLQAADAAPSAPAAPAGATP